LPKGWWEAVPFLSGDGTAGECNFTAVFDTVFKLKNCKQHKKSKSIVSEELTVNDSCSKFQAGVGYKVSKS
jgi:hypothetical protein